MVRVVKSNPVEPAVVDDYWKELAGRGKIYMPAELPDDLKYGELGHCFDNCLLAALASDGKYRYVEGVGILFDEAHAHAWLTDEAGEVAYDLTWRVQTKDRAIAAPALYKGVVLDTEACKRYVLSTGYAGIIGNRDRNPRLFKQVLKASNLL